MHFVLDVSDHIRYAVRLYTWFPGYRVYLIESLAKIRDRCLSSSDPAVTAFGAELSQLINLNAIQEAVSLLLGPGTPLAKAITDSYLYQLPIQQWQLEKSLDQF